MRRSRPIPAARALAGALLLAVAACAGSGSEELRPLGEAGPGGPQISLIVDNQNFNDVTIYGLGEGMRRRIGIVPGKTEKRFQFPWRSNHIRLQASILAGPDFTTEELLVEPGETFELIVRSNLRASGVRR